MKRVSVIGCPGAGKTEFAKRLSQQLSIPIIHLDLTYHNQNFPYQTDREAWREAMRQLVKGDTWLIDGNYKSSFDLRFPGSDTIIFLYYPTYVCVWRAVKRRIHFNRIVRDDMPATWKEKLGWEFFWFIVRFNRKYAKRILEQIDSYKEDKNIVILKNPLAAERFLKSLNDQN